MPQLEFHPLCTLFPRLTGAEFDALVGDIATNGLREPITIHDGMILDGGNRYEACIAAGVEPRFVKFRGDSIGAFVLSANLHRRHMSAGQQAAIVASVQDWAKAQAHGGDRSSAHVSTCSDTTASRAKTSGASISTQRRADAVAKASPEVAKEVATGQKSLAEAVRQVAPKLAPRTAEPMDDVSPSLSELVDELQRENELLRAELEALKSTLPDDDLRQQLSRAVRIVEHAKREQGVAMDNASQSQKREAYAVKMCRACGKAAGVADPNHTDLRDIVKAVQAYTRRAA